MYLIIIKDFFSGGYVLLILGRLIIGKLSFLLVLLFEKNVSFFGIFFFYVLYIVLV